MPAKLIHGMSDTKTYGVWRGMRRRCAIPTTAHYAMYGGRGITVCDRWLDFANFLSDMGEQPRGKTLDRINNDKGYSPENCRWATPAEQRRNSRDNKFLTFNGKTQCIADWQKELGLSRGAIQWRIKLKWPLAKILSPQHHSRHERT